MPPACTSVEAEIRGFLEYQLEHAAAVGKISKVALYRSLCDPEVACAIGRQFAETRVALLRQRLSALQARGLIDPEADLEAAATALASLSFGLAFVDQLVFGADCARLRRVARHVARVYAAGLAPPPPGLRAAACAKSGDQCATDIAADEPLDGSAEIARTAGRGHGKLRP